MAERGARERLGGGGSSEVFAWDEGRVVKLFLTAYEHAVEREHDVARAVHGAGVPLVPRFQVAVLVPAVAADVGA